MELDGAARRNLVVLRVGPNSLHDTWFSSDGPRNWDLYLSPYVPIEPPGVDCTVGEVVPGPKWSGIREVLHGWSGWRNYDHNCRARVSKREVLHIDVLASVTVRRRSSRSSPWAAASRRVRCWLSSSSSCLSRRADS